MDPVEPNAPSPVVVLVGPQMAENVGACARAMLNCGLTELRVVAPCFAWPDERVTAMAAGADGVVEGARLFESTAEAVADLHFVAACSARSRDMNERRQSPRVAAAELRRVAASGARTGLLFGPERSGLANDDLVHADRLITVPLNPEFRSLNLAAAVLVVAYEWWVAEAEPETDEEIFRREGRLATKGELGDLADHLERALGDEPFERLRDKRPMMLRNLRNSLVRAGFTDSEVRALHWVLRHLERRRGR